MTLRQTTWALAVVFSLCVTSAFAQDQKQEPSPIDPNAPLQPLDTPPSPKYPNKQPIGAARGIDAPFDPQRYDPSLAAPDTNTLAGAVPFTVGSLQHSRTVFDPSISVSQLGQTFPLPDGKSIITGVSVASGSLNLDRTWSEYHLSATYNGGETFNYAYSRSAANALTVAPHYQFHDLTFVQQADWARWHVQIRDNFVASPGAEFTGQGMGGPGLAAQFSALLGSSFSTLAQSFLPSESINTLEAMRYMNSVLGQAEYSFTRRSAMTFSGSYGLLHFTTPGFFGSTMANAQAGYDYLLDPANSVAVLGSYGRVSFTGSGSAIADYMAALAYGRKITGRLAFQAAAGPQEILVTGSGTTPNFHLLLASVNSALKYERRRTGLSLSFARGLTSGSGVLVGATSDTFTGAAHYQLTRFWTASVNGGYAINNGLVSAGSSPRFDNWFVGGNLGWQVGQHAQFNFNYGAQRQNNPSNCALPTCNPNLLLQTGLQQTVGVSVNWHLRSAGYGY